MLYCGILCVFVNLVGFFCGFVYDCLKYYKFWINFLDKYECDINMYFEICYYIVKRIFNILKCLVRREIVLLLVRKLIF